MPAVESPSADAPVAARTWAALVSISLGTFALVTTEFLPVGLLKEIAGGLGVTEGTAGLAVTMPGVVAAVAGPLMMLAAGRIDRRLGLVLMTALLAASNAVAALAPNIALMLAGRFLLGLAVGGFWALAVSAAARMVPPTKMGSAIAVVLAGISAGTVLGVPAGALIGEWAGWRSAFVAAAVAAALILVAQAVVLPRLPVERGVRPAGLVALFRRRDALVGLAATVLVIAGHFAAYTFVTPFLIDLARFDRQPTTMLLAAYGVAAFLGNFIAGRLATGRTRATLAGVALLTAGVTLVLPLSAPFAVAAGLLVVVWGAAFGGLPVALQTWMYKASGDEKEAGQVVFNSVFQWALALGALIGGTTVDRAGIAAAMMVGGLLALAAAVLVAAAGASRAGRRTPALP